MSDSEVISEHTAPPFKMEGTPEEVAKQIVKNLIAPAALKLAWQDQEAGMDFCLSIMGATSGCLAVLCRGDKAKFAESVEALKDGLDLALADFKPAPTRH